MSIGTKTATAAWLGILGVGCAFAVFGLSKDNETGLRDSLIELEMLKSEPSDRYIQFCAAREAAKVLDEPEGARLAKAIEQASGMQLIGADIKIEPELWCPMPSPNESVRSALNFIKDAVPTSVLVPATSFFVLLGRTAKELAAYQSLSKWKAGPLPEQWDNKIGYLAADLLKGTKITRIDVTTEVNLGIVGCLHSKASFEIDVKKVPPATSKLIIYNDDQMRCFTHVDVPTGTKLASLAPTPNEFALQDYFRHRLNDFTSYSSTSIGSRFSFPALTARLSEFGGESVIDAYNSINLKLAASDNTLQLFGLKLPLQLSLFVATISLPVFAILFFLGLMENGRAVLPDIVQGLPYPLRLLTCLGALSALPAFAIYMTAFRLRHSIPQHVDILEYYSASWLIVTSIATIKMREKLSGND